MIALLRDLRLAWRALLRQPGFLAVSVLTLGLGVGSVSAIYSVVDGVLLKPLPYPDGERIVRITRVQQDWSGPISAPAFADWREGTEGVFASFGGFTSITLNLTGEGDAERLNGYRVTPGFWQVMGMAPQHGRWFGEAEEAASERVAVLSHELWQRRYGGDAGIVGSDVVLNGEPYRVVGVAPATFRYPGGTQVYLPTWLAASETTRGSNFINVVARLRDDADLAKAASAFAVVNARLQQAYPEEHADLSVRITPLPELLNSGVREPLVMLLGASGLVLLIACANLANLLMARATRRQRELAVRSALGAGRAALVRGVLAEAIIVALLGAALGLLLATAAVPALLAVAPGIVPSHGAPGVSLAVIAASLLAALGTVLVFAAWPAWRASRAHAGAVLQEEGRAGGGGRDRARGRAVLVAAEVALSLTLLVGAGLLIESLRQLGSTETGVDFERVLTASVVVDGANTVPGESPQDWYARHTRILAPRLDALLERLAAIPGVEAAALSDALPLSGMNNISSDVEIVGRELPEGARAPGANWRFVSPDFAQALGMRIVRGRDLESGDRAGEFPTRVLVNETFVRRFLADVDPLGQRVAFFWGEPKEIVGVISDASLNGIDHEAIPEVYVPHAYAVQTQFSVALRVRGAPAAYAEQLRRAVREHDPRIPVFDVRPMGGMVAETTQLRRFNMGLMSVFSAVALLLAVIGLYGVISYSVAQRTHEFGIRMSLGAAPRRVLGMVLGQGARLVLAGLALGLVGAVALSRAIASQLYGVAPADPKVIAGVCGLLLLAGLTACLLPAWRASRVAPAHSMRDG